MVAALSQLHNNVEQPRLGFAFATGAVDGVDILLENLLVPLDLHIRHAKVEVDFLLGKETLLDITLDTSEQERPKDAMQLLDDGVLVTVLTGEPLIKGFRVTKDVG